MTRAWQDFREQTAIHGFTEYAGMKKNYLKAAWVCVCAVVAVCCALLLVDIFRSFASHEQVTSVEVLDAFPMPAIAFRFGRDVGRILEKSNLHSIQHVVYQQAVGGSACTFVEGHEASEAKWSPTTNCLHGSADLKHFTEEFEKLIPSPDYYMDTDSLMVSTAKGEGLDGSTVKPSPQPQLSVTGPVFKFDLSNFSTHEIRDVTAFIKKPADNGFDFFEILAGSDTGTFGSAKGEMLESQTDYALRLQLRELRYSSYYCDESYKTLACKTSCALEMAKADNSLCVPYLGREPQAEGTRVCSGSMDDYWACTDTMEACHQRCQRCQSCRQCARTTGEWTVMSKGAATANVSTVSFELSTGGVVRYSSSEKYPLAAFFSQLGGILGLGFGISMVSLCHLFCTLVKAGATCESCKKGSGTSKAGRVHALPGGLIS